MDFHCAARGAFGVLLVSGMVCTAQANTPPTAPGNLTVSSHGLTTATLRWDASSDDKRVNGYRVFVNQIDVGTTRSLSYELTGLTPSTSYQVDVDATDGEAYSFLSSASFTTSSVGLPEGLDDPTSETVTTVLTSKSAIDCRGRNKRLPECQANPDEEPPEEDPSTEDPSPDESPVDCRGRNKRLPACQDPSGEEPPTEEPPVDEPPVDEPPVDEPPTEEPPVSTGPPAGWGIVFEDHFDGYGDLDTSSSDKLWRFETMQDGLHRAGNSGMDEFGDTDVPDWQSARGKRWSAWYDKYTEENAYRSAGNLVMQGLVSGEADPTRPDDYLDNGILTQYGSSKLYTAWIDTWSRKYVNDLGKHVTDPDSPGRTFKYGYFETRVNFSEMKTPGFRLSMWLMPASTDAEGQYLVESTAYDSDGDNGVEIDLFEYEWIGVEHENRLQLSVHGGAAGGSSTNYDTSESNIAIHEGWHTIGFLWEADRLVWSIDGKVIKTVTDVAIIPDVYSYLIVSREMNSGVKTEGIDSINEGDVLEVLPYRPRDPGLYAHNVWEFRDRIATDRALVDYIKVWQPPHD